MWKGYEREEEHKGKDWQAVCAFNLIFTPEWVIVEFLDTFRIVYACRVESPSISQVPKQMVQARESLFHRILVAPGWSDHHDDHDDDSQRLYNWCQRKLPRTDLIEIYFYVRNTKKNVMNSRNQVYSSYFQDVTNGK